MRFSRGAQAMGLQVVPFDERSDWQIDLMQPQSWIFRIVDVFTTHNGSWDVEPSTVIEDVIKRPLSSQRFRDIEQMEGALGAPYFGIDQWARDAYLFPPNDPRYLSEGGGDHHIFACVQNPEGKRMAEAGVAFTSDGPSVLQPPAPPASFAVTKAHGWCDLVMYPSSICRPPAPGPWSVTKLSQIAAADILVGVGLPWNWHVSTFVVFQAISWEAYQAQTLPLEDVLKTASQARQVLQLNPNAALQKVIFSDGFVPTSPEFDVTYSGTLHRCQRAERLSDGICRCYYCLVPNWTDVQFIQWTI